MEKKLSILGVVAIFVFIVVFSIFDIDSINNSLWGKFFVGFIVLGGITPWLYLMEKSRGKVSNKRLAIYFFGSWLLAPYFLLKLHERKRDAP